jgi:hypothetical protein
MILKLFNESLDVRAASIGEGHYNRLILSAMIFGLIDQINAAFGDSLDDVTRVIECEKERFHLEVFRRPNNGLMVEFSFDRTARHEPQSVLASMSCVHYS